MDERERAVAAVEAIFKDLRGRSLLKWIFDDRPNKVCSHFASIDLDVQEEIADAWTEIIERAIRPTPSKEQRDE